VTSDRRGFEYAELGPEPLPGLPPSYLDVAPSENDEAYGFELLTLGNDAFIRYSRYLRIRPNDSRTDRGAYLSVGFVSRRALAMHVAANCIDLVSQIYGHLKSFVGPDNRVSPDFKLGSYAYDEKGLNDKLQSPCSTLLLLDVLMQGLKSEGSLTWKPRRPIFIEPSRLAGEGEIDRHSFYFDKGTPGTQLRFDRERERLKSLAERLVLATGFADQVRDEWLSYQSMIQEHLPSVADRGVELSHLIDDVERLAQEVDYIDASNSGPKAAYAASGLSASSAIHPHRPGVPGQSRAAAGRGFRAGVPRRPNRPHRRRFPPAARRVSLGIGGAIILAAIVTAALQFVGGRSESDGTEGLAGPVDESSRGQLSEPAESAEADTADESRSGVAQERAALGQSRPD
jgi:hypothetical protein